MNDIRMGFKHAILQRMQSYEPATPVKFTAATMQQNKNSNSNSSSSNSSPILPQPHVTDFSINRILGDKHKKDASAALPSANKTSLTKVPTTNTINSMSSSSSTSYADILDLSKSSTGSAAATTLPYAASTYAAAIQQDFLAAAAAANATKFYAQFFPQMFPAYHQALTTHPATYAKRYFAPYVVNSSATLNAATAPTRLTSNVTASSNVSAFTHNHHNVLRPKVCTRECTDCIVYYQQHADKSAAFNTNLAGSLPGTASVVPYLKTKTSAEIMCSSSAASSSSFAATSSSLISLTTVANLNISAKVNKLEALKNSASALSSEEISYKCRICDKVFGCSQTLQAHERTHKSPRYECTDCGKGFSQLRNYKYHLSVHRGTKEFAAECTECGKTFNDKGYLSSHMKIHRNKKEYECPYCPKSFNQRVAFNMHVRIHTGVKPHKCAECGKRFSRKMLLKQHMRTHSGEKPYQCSVCGKSFADRSNMTLHHRLHSGIKPFNCPICPKAFTKKHHLKTHLNYHTGCKPYVCPHPNCNQAFSQSSNMRTHAKKCQYRPLQTLTFPATTAANINSNTTATSTLFTATPPTTSTSNNSYSPYAALRLPTSSSTNGLASGMRMLSAASFNAQMPLPPAQQQLVSTLRPF